MSNGIRICLYTLGTVMLLTLAACSGEKEDATTKAGSQPTASQDRNLEETQGMVLLRGLPTLGTTDAVAIVELDPEAENFGEILEGVEFSGYDQPLHHPVQALLLGLGVRLPGGAACQQDAAPPA